MLRRATLMLPVYYDDEKTDGESTASAFDTLLETIMSTPGILDDYGNVEVGEFSLEFDDEFPEKHARNHLLRLGEIDGPLLAEQRGLVYALAYSEELPTTSIRRMQQLGCGLSELLDTVADQLHDRYGVDCLSKEQKELVEDENDEPAFVFSRGDIDEELERVLERESTPEELDEACHWVNKDMDCASFFERVRSILRFRMKTEKNNSA